MSGSCNFGRLRPGPHCASRSAWTGPFVPSSCSVHSFYLGSPRWPRAHLRRERLRRRLARHPRRGNADCSLWHPDADATGDGADGDRHGNGSSVGPGDRRGPDGGSVAERRVSGAGECRNTHGSAFRGPLGRSMAEDSRSPGHDLVDIRYGSTTRRPTGPALAPPSMITAAPLMYSARGDASISTPRATSSGVPGRPSEAALRAPSR